MTDMMPIIRYKEFSEPWVRCKLNELLIVVTDKNHGNYTNSSLQLLSRLPIAPSQGLQGFEQSA